MPRIYSSLFALFVIHAAAIGCNRSSEPAAPAQATAPVLPAPAHVAGQLPPGHMPTSQGAAPSAPPNTVGTVLETMNASSYTYMKLRTEQGEVWVATSQMQVAVGDRVQASGDIMRGFHSRTLDRTFDEIVFASSASVAPSGAAAPAHAPAHATN